MTTNSQLYVAIVKTVKSTANFDTWSLALPISPPRSVRHDWVQSGLRDTRIDRIQPVKVSPLQTYCRPAWNTSSFRVFTLAKQQTIRDVIDFPKRRHSLWRKSESAGPRLDSSKNAPTDPPSDCEQNLEFFRIGTLKQTLIVRNLVCVGPPDMAQNQKVSFLYPQRRMI